MNCNEVRELLSPMTDREVSKDDLKLIEEHLNTCQDCAFQSTMMVGMKNLLRQWDGLKPTEVFHTRVLDRVKSEPPPSALSRLSPGIVGSIVAAVAAVGLGVVFVLTGGKVPPGTQAQKRPDGQVPAAGAGEVRPSDADRPIAPVAQVARTSGAVHVTPPGDASSLGSAGDVLSPGYAMRVAGKSWVDLALVGGFQMRLERGAEIVFRGDEVRGELRQGRVLVRPAGPAAKLEHMTIACRDASVRPLTSDAVFSCERLDDDATRIIVARGDLEVAIKGNRQRLRPGTVNEIALGGAFRATDQPATEADLAGLTHWEEK
jgi:hypothetical protein